MPSLNYVELKHIRVWRHSLCECCNSEGDTWPTSGPLKGKQLLKPLVICSQHNETGHHLHGAWEHTVSAVYIPCTRYTRGEYSQPVLTGLVVKNNLAKIFHLVSCDSNLTFIFLTTRWQTSAIYVGKNTPTEQSIRKKIGSGHKMLQHYYWSNLCSKTWPFWSLCHFLFNLFFYYSAFRPHHIHSNNKIAQDTTLEWWWNLVSVN